MNALWAGVAGAVVALLCAHGRHTPYDNYVLLAQAWLHGRVDIDALWPGTYIDAVAYQGHRYVIEGPVPAALLLPFVAIFGTNANETFVACLLCGVASGAAWLLLERLGVPRGNAVWLLVFLLLGTQLTWCAMLGDVWFIAQVSSTAFVLLALAELAGPRRGALVGLWFVLAVGSRFTELLALPVLWWWLSDGFTVRERRPREILRSLAVIVPAAALWAAYNVARWHVPWDDGYALWFHADPAGSPVGSPFELRFVPYQLWSFFVQLPSLQRSAPYVIPSISGVALWFTSPALLLAVRARRPARIVLGLWAATLLVAAPSFVYYVNGFAQFGMRHALDFEPYTFALMGLSAQRRLGPPWRVLIGWSAAVGVWGIWYWNAVLRATM